MNSWHLQLAVRHLHRGGVVLHATEGVWGLACDPANAAAVHELLRLKGRPMHKGLVLIGAAAACFAAELDALDPAARAEVGASWPGAVTWILPSRRFPVWITGGRSSVAVRVPGHPDGRALAAGFGAPLVSSSANPSGRPAARNRWQARAWLRGIRRAGLLRGHARGVYLLPGETLGRRGPSEIRLPGGGVLR